MMKHKESSSPPSLNPWEALFSSATRSQPIISLSNNANDDVVVVNGGEDDVDANKVSSCDATTSSSTIMQNNTHHRHMNNKGGYTILIQYSITPVSQRKWALLTSTMTTTNSNSININSNINSRNNTNREGMSLQPLSTPRSSSSSSSASAPYGILGPFVIQQALEVLCNKCNGAVIFVSTLGMNSIFLDINNSVVDQESESYNMKSSIDDNDNDDGEDENNIQTLQKKRRNAIHMFQRHGACVDLSSDPFGWELDDGIDNSTQNSNNCSTKDTSKDDHGSSNISTYSCAMDKLQSIAMTIRRAAASIESRRRQGQEEQEENMQQPIPIVFESMTPLLNIHGVEKVGVLLKSLGSVNSGTETTTNYYSILSPIVAPILYESIRPSDHRYLEDISDAMLHVSLVGEGSSNPSSSSSASASSSSTGVISSGVLDLVRRGGSRGLGGKFIRHCIPFHVMRLKTPTAAAATTAYGQFQSSYYWILDHNDDEKNYTENDTVTVKKKLASDNNSNGIIKSDEQGKEETSVSRPRIFMQDDDPEYDDYDEEEDLDDDLDL